MIRWITVFGLLSLVVPVLSPTAFATRLHPRLIAAPVEGHAGSSFYLSGGNFAPNEHLVLATRCSDGRVSYRAGPMTSPQGSFVAFSMTAPVVSSARLSRCTISAARTLGKKALPGEVPARYQVVPVSRALPACALHMCAKVTAVLVQTRQGVQGNIVVTSWPGAVASAAVVYPGGKVKYRGVRIGWQGSGAVRVRIAKHIKASMKTRVYVTAVLGSASATSVATFIVLPGLNR